MKLLQMITDFNNTEHSCPAAINRCELVFDSENTRMLLQLALRGNPHKIKNARVDICCYDKDGFILSVVKGVECNGEVSIPLPSLMTYSASVILREAELASGDVWESDTEFPTKVEITGADGAFSDTARFDPISIEEDAALYGGSSVKSKRELRQEKFAREEEIRQIIKSDPKERKKRVITRLVALFVVIAAIAGSFFVIRYTDAANSAYKRASNLYNSGKFEDAIPALEAASEFIFFGDEKDELCWLLAMSYARQRDFYNAAIHFSNLGDYKESKANYMSISKAYKNIISAGGEHTLGLCGDGTVVAVGNNKYKQCEVDSWHNITDISAGTAHTVGVRGSGKVVATGDNEYGQCDVGKWSGIISASAGDKHTAALKIDGTVIATGSNEYGQCNVDKWTNVMSITAGYSFTAGLTYDGEILIAGGDDIDMSNLSEIKNALFISSGDYNIVCVTKDGAVFSVGSNANNQGATSVWKNIVIADGGSRHSVGVTADGKAVAAGESKYSQTDVDDWKNISIPKNTVTIRKGTENN